MKTQVKSFVVLVSFIVLFISCKPDCDSFPVDGRSTGDYVILKDLSVHFIGRDESYHPVDILIPPKYYSLKDNGDSTFELDMFCTYRPR